MIFKLLFGSFHCFYTYKWVVFKKTATPISLYFLIQMFSPFVLGDMVGVGVVSVMASVAVEIIALMLISIVSVSVIRLVLLEEERRAMFSFARREVKYLLYSVVVVLIFAVPTALASVSAVLDLIYPGIFFGSLIGFLIALWCVCRISLVFPSVAVDKSMSFKKSWRLTKDSRWVLTFYVVVLSLVIYVPIGLLQAFLSSFPVAFISDFFDLIVHPLVDIFSILLFSFGLAIYYSDFFMSNPVLKGEGKSTDCSE
ncbi:hypothetical protein [Vreelandella alkaliphila]|uniref:Glycerophosphoryl diester phosphodiesterase membrane domain-containing protein n=1 Tax=Vreelandella alkaliphila TaxID=272774 RepID=A0A7C9P256_9GAMM|nr:hypothetical protein [Halomonas alkaliphila]NDL72053.1 hypothetical protein [Halomonas alkaliphila]